MNRGITRSVSDYCPDCNASVIWARQGDLRAYFEVIGETTTVRWNNKTQWHEIVDAPILRQHACEADPTEWQAQCIEDTIESLEDVITTKWHSLMAELQIKDAIKDLIKQARLVDAPKMLESAIGYLADYLAIMQQRIAIKGTPMPNAEQLALAERLYAAGLAPKGAERQQYQDGPVFWWGDTRKWEPWRSWDAVSHLVIRFQMDILQNDYEHTIIAALMDSEKCTSGADIPAAIGRLALRLTERETSNDVC